MQDFCKNMSPGKHLASIAGSRQQQGVALVVVLLFLVAITGISVHDPPEVAPLYAVKRIPPESTARFCTFSTKSVAAVKRTTTL